jgi:hypothetical protein
MSGSVLGGVRSSAPIVGISGIPMRSNSLEKNGNMRARGGVEMSGECTHCGTCCLSGIPCLIGQMLFDISEVNPQICPACQNEDGLYWCGLIRNPVEYFSVWVGDKEWKCRTMADIARIYIGIGQGCGMSPTKHEIIKKMKEICSNRRR